MGQRASSSLTSTLRMGPLMDDGHLQQEAVGPALMIGDDQVAALGIDCHGRWLPPVAEDVPEPPVVGAHGGAVDAVQRCLESAAAGQGARMP